MSNQSDMKRSAQADSELPRQRRTVRYRKRFIRVCVGILFATVVLEVALRLGWGLGNPPLLQADSEIGYLFRPNQQVRRIGNWVKINAYHQRSEDVSEHPSQGAFRILCIGDSVTWGGVQTDQTDTYPELLATALREKCRKKPIEVLNASAGSWGLGNEAAYLRRFGTFGSQWVVLQIGSHDLTQPPSTGDAIGKDPTMPSERPLFAIEEAVCRYVAPRFSRRSCQSPSEDGSERDQFDRNILYLEAMVRQCRGAGARVLILHTPDREEVVAGANGYASRYDDYRQLFMAFCRAREVHVIDLVTEWRRHPDPAPYFRDTVHPNPNGNKVIASSIASYIELP